MNKRQLVSFFV